MMKRGNTQKPTLKRHCQFEVMEDRINFSTNPLASVATFDKTSNMSDNDVVQQPEEQRHDGIETLALISPSSNTQQKYNNMTGLDAVKNLYGLNGSGQTVVIIDSGVAYDHEALGGGFGDGYRIVGGYDFAENDNDPYDAPNAGSHGTHVAGIIASSSTLYPGVAPGVDLVVLRVFDNDGDSSFEWLNMALQWVHQNKDAFANPITTINLSIGFQEDNPGVTEMLNASLKVLYDDGIFISVAAGNSFTTRPDQINCLANSEYVVAVGACDTTGSLSYFSQRNESIIVAPGQNIKSTVPDYAGNKNGIADDYATMSGTSMASPYVAAASTLIRQAFQLVGKTNVNQNDIYNVMFNTADTIFDAATGKNYKRLNIQKAIESILPQDTFSDSAKDPTPVSSLDETFVLEGFLNTKTDQDYFIFTAEHSGSVTIKAETTPGLNGVWDVSKIPGAKVDSAGNVTFEVVAGQQYTFGYNATGTIGAYTIKAWMGDHEPVDPPVVDPPIVDPVPDPDPPVPKPEEPELPPDPGTAPETPNDSVGQEENKTPTEVAVDQAIFNHQKLTGEGTWYAMTATRSGIMTVEIILPNGIKSQNVIIEQTDAQGNVIATSQNTTRLDLNMTAGSTVWVRIRSVGEDISDADVKVTNLVRQEGKNVFIVGTNGDDDITFTAGTSHTVTINGTRYTFLADEVGTISIDAGAGNDRILLVGTSQNERLDIDGTEICMSGDSWKVNVTGVEYAVIESGGGKDSFRYHDTPGDDEIIARPDRITISSDGFYAEVKNYSIFYAYSSRGGNDTAILYDSVGNDSLTISATYAIFNVLGLSSQIYNFNSLIVHSVNGGQDSVTFTDTKGDDLFVGNARNMKRYSGTQYAEVNGFARIDLISLYGGNDTVLLEDSTGNDTLTISQNNCVLAGAGYSISVRGFDKVRVSAVHGGNNTVKIYDTPESSVVVAKNNALGVVDTVYEYWVDGFDNAWIFARSMGENRLERSTIDYILHVLGDWKEE